MHNEKRYSNCCAALPVGELSVYPFEGSDTFMEYHGRCSSCKDGAIFFTEEELAKTDGYDEGMGMGGDKYYDVMFGDERGDD